MGQQQAGKQPGQQSQPNGGKQGAQDSNLTGGGSQNVSGEDIEQKMKEWGGVTAREREAIIEGSNETILERYRRLTDAYYRELAKRSTENR